MWDSLLGIFFVAYISQISIKHSSAKGNTMEFIGYSIGEVWEKSIYELIRNNDYCPTERGMRTIEIRNALLTILQPNIEPRISDKYIFSSDFINNYSQSMKEYWDAVKKRFYAYGSKRIDQVQYVVEKLKSNWYTRRAFITLWYPDEDTISLHPPCPIGVQFLIRGSELHATTILRSNDAWLSAIPDILSLTDIQIDIANKLGLGVGSYTQHSISYHIYEQDILMAMEIFGA